MGKVYLWKDTQKSDRTGRKNIMENKSHTGSICCSGAKIRRIPRGRQRIAPKMDRVLLEVGDVILYNEKISEGMRARGHLSLESSCKCMVILFFSSFYIAVLHIICQSADTFLDFLNIRRHIF